MCVGVFVHLERDSTGLEFRLFNCKFIIDESNFFFSFLFEANFQFCNYSFFKANLFHCLNANNLCFDSEFWITNICLHD